MMAKAPRNEANDDKHKLKPQRKPKVEVTRMTVEESMQIHLPNKNDRKPVKLLVPLVMKDTGYGKTKTTMEVLEKGDSLPFMLDPNPTGLEVVRIRA